MAIVIFGGNGFVGSHLVKELLAREEEVIVCDKENKDIQKRAAFIKCDIRNAQDFESIPLTASDIVVNLAANQYHHKVPRKERKEFFFDVNYRGVQNILNFMEKRAAKKLIQFTSDMIYGKPCYLPVDVNHPQMPFGFYGQSKKAAEELCREYRGKGFYITIFRPRMINGPGRLGILEKLFYFVHHNLPVPMIGSGKNCYQMISVHDCVSAIIAAAEKNCPNKEYNLGSKNPPSIRSLLMNLIKQSGSKSFVIPAPGAFVKVLLGILGSLGIEIMYKEQYMIADENYILDISETEKDLNWTPRRTDADMLVEAYKEWIKQV
jgi:dTDP-glucose 4,6-dehydratase